MTNKVVSFGTDFDVINNFRIYFSYVVNDLGIPFYVFFVNLANSSKSDSRTCDISLLIVSNYYKHKLYFMTDLIGILLQLL